jgi:hypothetical protein
MSELDAEVKAMTTDDLEEAFAALHGSLSKGVRDEFMQELYARELDHRYTFEFVTNFG